MGRIGAVVGGANRFQTIEDDELPYGGMLKVPVYLMTHEAHEPIERDGTTYTFVVDDISEAVELAARSAGDGWVSLLGGSISRQCLRLGLVDELHLHVAPVLLGDGISLFAGLGQRIELERLESSAYASETHLRYRSPPVAPPLRARGPARGRPGPELHVEPELHRVTSPLAVCTVAVERGKMESMCATNLWAINAAAFTSEFQRFTEDRLGMPPVQTTMRIASRRVRGSSVVFTLTSGMCDCDSLIGRRSDAPVHGEIEADVWLGWLRDMPDHVSNVSRVAVLRAWSPEDDDVVPSHARGVRVGDLTEDVLRDIRDDSLLTIDYPRVA